MVQQVPVDPRARADIHSDGTLHEVAGDLAYQRLGIVGFGAVSMGALVMTLLLRVLAPQPWDLFRSLAWVSFWSTLSAHAVMVAVFAAAAGAFSVTTGGWFRWQGC